MDLERRKVYFHKVMVLIFFSKTWIIMTNKRNIKKWKSTDGTNNVQIIELKNNSNEKYLQLVKFKLTSFFIDFTCISSKS